MLPSIIHAGQLAIFEQLKSFVGSWSGKTKSSKPLSVTYSLNAKVSVLMERWQLSEKTDALTLYHMDNDNLISTHYCPLCNQPRLNLSHVQDGEIGFEFVSVTNLRNASHGYQHSFQVKLMDQDTFWRSETYVGEGGFTEVITYFRTSPTAHNA